LCQYLHLILAYAPSYIVVPRIIQRVGAPPFSSPLGRARCRSRHSRQQRISTTSLVSFSSRASHGEPLDHVGSFV
jgi:hypothetical protein